MTPDRSQEAPIEGGAAPATRPQAYHAGIPTFMRRPMADLARLRPGMTAVFGIPHDYTSGSRPGARWGPRGIRQSSAYFDYFLRSSPDASYVDLETGREVRFPAETTIRLAAQALFQFLAERAPAADGR